MFAVMSMEVNSNLLKLKLDMVYRDLPLEEAEKRFADIMTPQKEPEPVPVVRKAKRKSVKALVPKNK